MDKPEKQRHGEVQNGWGDVNPVQWKDQEKDKHRRIWIGWEHIKTVQWKRYNKQKQMQKLISWGNRALGKTCRCQIQCCDKQTARQDKNREFVTKGMPMEVNGANFHETERNPILMLHWCGNIFNKTCPGWNVYLCGAEKNKPCCVKGKIRNDNVPRIKISARINS